MPTPDDLSSSKAKPFSDAVDKFEELMTQSGRAFCLEQVAASALAYH